MISSSPRFELSCSEERDNHVKYEKSGSSHQNFHVNEPFYHNGGYKINKPVFFLKKEVNQFIRVKTKKTDQINTLIRTIKTLFFEKFHSLKKSLTKFKKMKPALKILWNRFQSVYSRNSQRQKHDYFNYSIKLSNLSTT